MNPVSDFYVVAALLASRPRRGRRPSAGDQVTCQPATNSSTTSGVRTNCRITRYSNGEPFDTVAIHGLARAYQAAWRSIFASDPAGQHVIAELDVVFVFSAEAFEAP